jgi:hypothetical protein
LTSLVKKIDLQMATAGKYPEGRKLGIFFIMSDAPGLADQLRDLARKENLHHVSFCIGAVPPRYEVNGEAEVTVVIYNPARRNQQAVTANFALRPGELDETQRDAIVEALAKVLPK